MLFNVNPVYINMTSLSVTVSTVHFICTMDNYSKDTELLALTCIYDMFENYTRTTQVIFDYTASYSDTNSGIYKDEFKVNGTQNYVIFTHFEPTRFRNVFPSLDEPSLKSSLRLSVQHYTNLTVVSNMDVSEFGRTYSKFQATPSMSTYLLAVVAGPSDAWQVVPASEKHDFNFSIFAQTVYKEYLSTALSNGPKLLELMGKWANLPYETLGNTKMTFAALPGMGGAMENWGLITFRERLLIDEGIRTTQKALAESLTIMAHEVTHQWLGNYVTFSWWSEVWLNEGFATYFQYYLAHMLSEKYEFDKKFLSEVFQPALQADNVDAMPLSNIDSNVNSRDDIEANFDTNASIPYYKGASLIRMIRYAVGENIFQKAVQKYLKKHALGNVKASDLVQELQAALPSNTDVDLPTYLNSWVYQPGYPIVKTYFADSGQDSYLISMNFIKFSTSLDENEKPEDAVWWVPITYATSDQPFWDNATTFWINPDRTFEFIIPKTDDSWGVLNVHSTGFYRVDYDSQTLGRIMKVLNNSETYTEIPVLNRAQILDDLFNVAKYYTKQDEGNRYRPYENAFSTSQYLRHEEDYLPWYTYLKEVQYLLDELDSGITESTLEADVLELIEAQLIIPNNTNSRNLTHLETLRRNLLLDWACKLGQRDALQYVQEEFEKYKQDTTSINSEFRDVIICYGISNSNDSEGDYSIMMNLYTKTILPQEQQDIVMGLACMGNLTLLRSYLYSTLKEDPPIEKYFWADIFMATYQHSSDGLDVALRFVVEHVQEIITKWKSSMKIEKMLRALGNKITTAKHYGLLENLLTTSNLDFKVTQTVKEAMKIASKNIDWIDQLQDEITSILVYGGGPVPTTPEPTTVQPPSGAGYRIYGRFQMLFVLISMIISHLY